MKCVLIVDDEPIERNGLSYLLEQRYDACLFTCANGLEAMELLLKTPIDVVITDIRMPHMDGITLAEQIRSHHILTNIILYSAYSDFAFAQKAIKAHVCSYLLKPLQPEVMYAEIDHYLAPKTELHVHCSSAEAVALAQAFIHSQYGDALSLDDVASAAHVSPSYLCSIFKQRVGCSPMRYLTQHRMKRAKAFIENTALSVTEIMGKCGFNHPSHFAAVFKAEFGLPPSEYLLQIKGKSHEDDSLPV